MSVIRVTSCHYRPTDDTYILSVDVVHNTDFSDLDRTHLIIAPRRDVQTKEQLFPFVEKEITAQQRALPDWSGISWKSSIE